MLLFIDYIESGPQSFDCYIFCFETFVYLFFFSISFLRIGLIDFYINYGHHFFNCYLFFSNPFS